MSFCKKKVANRLYRAQLVPSRLSTAACRIPRRLGVRSTNQATVVIAEQGAEFQAIEEG